MEIADIICVTQLSAAAQLRLSCSKTEWYGENGVCQVCLTPLPEGSRRKAFCSKSCARWFERNHIWRRARVVARRKAKYRCSNPECDATREDGIEINHIIPLVGAGYGPSCAHHEDNLEALCSRCHRKITNEQLSDRALKRREADK